MAPLEFDLRAQLDSPPMIALFSLRLLLGMALTWAVLPRRQITSGFFRIQLLLALALSVLATVTIREQTAILAGFEQLFPPNPIVDWPEPASFGMAACVMLSLLAFAGSVAWTLERRVGGTLFLLATLALSLTVLVVGALGAAQANRSNLPLFLCSEFGSSAVLGSSVAGMLLGHWYLTAPTMSIAPLGRANAWLGVSLLFRLALSAVGLWMARDSLSGSTHLVWLALRWSAGIVLPLILCVMTARILKYRNTQSATGVLFAAVIMIFLGELAGMLLSREIGMPL